MSDAVMQSGYEAPKRTDRFGLYLCLSLALHAVLLLAVAQVGMLAPRSASTVLVRLVNLDEVGLAGGGSPAPAASAAPAAAPAAVRAAPASRTPEPAAQVAAAPRERVISPNHEENIPAPPAPAEAPTGTEGSAPAGPAGDGPGGAAGGPGGPGTDIGPGEGHGPGGAAGLPASYLRLLSARVKRNRLYPDASRQDGEQGRVRVSFVVFSDGRLAEVRVAKSSGFERLDRAAVQAVEKSSPFPPFPAGVSLTRERCSLEVSFELE